MKDIPQHCLTKRGESHLCGLWKGKLAFFNRPFDLQIVNSTLYIVHI